MANSQFAMMTMNSIMKMISMIQNIKYISLFTVLGPLRVGSISITNIEETTVDLSWLLPASDYDYFLLRLFLQSAESPSVDTYVEEKSTSESNIMFDSMLPGASYQIQIWAVYNETLGYPSGVNVTTCKFCVCVDSYGVILLYNK